MADSQGRKLIVDDSRRHSLSRLQTRAPASIQVSPASSFAKDWKVAIPLLSPLVLSPASPKPFDLAVEVKSGVEPQRKEIGSEKTIFNMWQHPASPFYHEPASFAPAIVPKCR